MVDALDWLQSEGILVHLNCTMVPSNYDQWKALEDFAKVRQLDLRMTTYCFPPTRREKTCFERLEPEQAADLLVKDAYYREGPAGILRTAHNLDIPLPRTCELDNGEPMQCLAGRGQFWLTWNGGMTPCAMLTTPVVQPLETGFDAAWKDLHGQCAQIRLCPDCVECPDRKMCMNCAAVTFSETGSFDGKPEYMCRLTSVYRQTIKALAEQIGK